MFKDIRKRSKQRLEKVRNAESKRELAKMLGAIEDVLGVRLKLVRRKTDREKAYVYNKKETKLTFYSHPFWARDRRERLLQEKIILAMTAAKKTSGSIEAFEENLLELMAHGK